MLVLLTGFAYFLLLILELEETEHRLFCQVAYSSLNAIVAQLKNCPFWVNTTIEPKTKNYKQQQQTTKYN